METLTPYRLQQKKPALLTLIIMSSFASMGAVILTPALSQISKYFLTSTSHSQLTITLFLVGYALGQLIYGPLANRLGRKQAFYIGIVIATIGSIVSILSEPFDSFAFLIIGRLLEALGSSAGLVIAYTIINDFYYPRDARRMISFMALAFAVMPGLATMIGSLLIVHFQWISCFYFMLIYGLTLIIPVYFLTETATQLDHNALHVREIKNHYQSVSSNRLLRDASFVLGLVTMCIYIFAASVPLIAIHYLKMPTERYAFVGLIPFVGTALGALVSGLLNLKFSAHTLIKFGFVIAFIAAVSLAILFYSGIVTIHVLIITGFVFMFGGCIMSANLASIASSCAEDKAMGSAVMNFINIGMAVAGTFVLALTPGTQVFKMPLLFLCALGFMVVVRWWHRVVK